MENSSGVLSIFWSLHVYFLKISKLQQTWGQIQMNIWKINLCKNLEIINFMEITWILVLKMGLTVCMWVSHAHLLVILHIIGTSPLNYFTVMPSLFCHLPDVQMLGPLLSSRRRSRTNMKNVNFFFIPFTLSCSFCPAETYLLR